MIIISMGDSRLNMKLRISYGLRNFYLLCQTCVFQIFLNCFKVKSYYSKKDQFYSFIVEIRNFLRKKEFHAVTQKVETHL